MGQFGKISAAVMAFAGLILNMTRGGAVKRLGKYGKPLHHVCFGLAVFVQTLTVWKGAAAVLIAWAVFSLGWGRLVSAAINRYIDPVAPGKSPNLMDRICRPLEGYWLTFSLFGLTMRGAIIGLPVGLLLGSWWVPLAGCMMWFVYVGVSALLRSVGKTQYAWTASEAVFGGLLWLSVFL